MLVKIAVDIAIKMWMDYLDYKLKYIHTYLYWFVISLKYVSL